MANVIGDVSLTNKTGVFLGSVNLSNLNVSANQIVYSSDGENLDGSNNLTFDGSTKVHIGPQLGFSNSYPTNIEAVTNDNSSTQNFILQNKSAGTVASTNLYITNNSTVSEAANFCVLGMNGSNYAGANYVSEKKNGMYIANTNSDLALTVNALGSGAGLHLSGDGGATAISLNANNALSLGTTYNAGTDSFTYNCGSTGQVLTSAGTGSVPTWTTPSTGVTVANQADNRIITATSTNDALNAEANLSYDGTTLTQGSVKYNIASESVRISDNTLTGNQQIVIGHKNFSGNASVVCGYNSGKSGMTGSYQVILGHSCGIALTSGSGNVLIGGNTAQGISSGTNNTIVGVSAGAGQTTQSNNVIVGHNSRCTNAGGTTLADCAVFGQDVIAALTGSNEIQLGKSGTIAYAFTYGTRSDARDKTDIKDTEFGLNFIEKLKPRQYRFNYRCDYIVQNEDGTVTQLPNDESKKRNRFHNGFLAQEIEQTAQELNLDFAGIKHGLVNGGSDVYNMDYSELIAPLVKSVQELSARVKQLEAKLSV